MSAAPSVPKRKPLLAKKKSSSNASPKDCAQPSSAGAASDEVITDIVQLQCSPKSPVRRMGSGSGRGVPSAASSGLQDVPSAVRQRDKISNEVEKSVSCKEGESEVCTSGSVVRDQEMTNKEALRVPAAAKVGKQVESDDKTIEVGESKKSLCTDKTSLTENDRIKLQPSQVPVINTLSENNASSKPSPDLPVNDPQVDLFTETTTDTQVVKTEGNSQEEPNSSLKQLAFLHPVTTTKTEAPVPTFVAGAVTPKLPSEIECSSRELLPENTNPQNESAHRAATSANESAHREATSANESAHRAATSTNESAHRAATSANESALRTATNANESAHRAATSANEFALRAATNANESAHRAATSANQRQPGSNTTQSDEEEMQIPSNYGINYLKQQSKNNPTQANNANGPEHVIKTAMALRTELLATNSAESSLNKKDLVQQLLIATETQNKMVQSEGRQTETSESRRQSGRSSCIPPAYCGRPASVDPDNAITAAVASQAPTVLASEKIYRVMHACRFNGEEDLEVKAEEIVKELPNPENPFAGKKTLVGSVCRPGRKGYVPNFFLRRITQIDFEPWYLGKITRQYSEQLLLECDLPVRSFLVRHSGLGFIISVKSLNDDGRLIVKHITIAEVNGKYTMFNRDLFDTIPELVSFHTTRQGGYCFSHPFQKPKLGLSPGIMSPAPEIPEPRRSVSTIETPSSSAFKWWRLSFFGRKSLRKIRPTGATNVYNPFPK